MKKAIIIILLLPVILCAQPSLERSVIGSTGGSTEAGGVNLSYTVGETCVVTRIDGSIVLTEGFQQMQDTELSVEIAEINTDIKVYPNPTADKLVLNLNFGDDAKARNFVFLVTDLKGAILQTITCDAIARNHTEEIDFSKYVSGIYFIVIRTNEFTRSIKVQKTSYVR
ncbi:MAG: T9SS type A sorting domain-containing protein [Candidatus Kapabacteria bacterium]|jgi:hypothetical protein|nr:T9SS type A sorting domain-containing protein [Candidatus Kapabacteria bacterium]